MSSMRMGVAGALPSCPEGEPENSLLRHEYSMFWKEETPVSIELLLWSRHCPYPYCRLAHAFTAGTAHALTAGWHPFLYLLLECQKLREALLL